MLLGVLMIMNTTDPHYPDTRVKWNAYEHTLLTQAAQTHHNNRCTSTQQAIQ